MDRMGPAHHHRVGLGSGAGHEDGDEVVAIPDEELAGGPELQPQGTVDDVRRRQSEMEISTLRADGSRRPARRTR